MKRTREQIKAEMMKRVEKEIDELLDWREGSAPPNLSQFEEEILQARKGISQAMMEGMLSGEENQGPVESPECPTVSCADGKQRQARQGGRNTARDVADAARILCLSTMWGRLFPPWISSW